MIEEKKATNSIYILVLVTFVYLLVIGAERMGITVLFPEIAQDLGFSMLQLGTIWGMDPFAGIFVALISGLIVDRFGVRYTMMFIVFMCGIAGILRGFTNNFASIIATTFLLGIFAAMLPTVGQKVIALWFPGKRFALASTITSIGITIGGMAATMLSATVLSPALGGWRNVLILFGIPPVLLAILWLVTVRRPPAAVNTLTFAQNVPFRESFTHAVHVKEVWLLGIVAFGMMGTALSFAGYLPTYLRDIGWSTAAADTATTMYSVGGAIGSIPLVMLANKIGSHMKVLLSSCIVSVVALLVLPFGSAPVVWILITVIGAVRAAVFPFLSAITIDRKSVGVKYAGTAIGIVMTFNMLGSAVNAPIGNSTASISPGFPFIVWGIISGLSLIAFVFMREKRKPGTKVLTGR